MRQLLIAGLLALFVGYGCKTKEFTGFSELQITIYQPKIGKLPVTFLMYPNDTFYCSFDTTEGSNTYRYLWSNRTKAWTNENQQALIETFNDINFLNLDTIYHDNSLKDSLADLNCVIIYKKDSLQKKIKVIKQYGDSLKSAPKNVSVFIYRLLIAAHSKDRNLADTLINFKKLEN